MDDKDHYIFKIVLLGNSGVGKTSIVSQYVLNKYSLYQETTIGVDFKTKSTLLQNKEPVRYYIWDTAGQEKFYSITNNYYKHTCGAIIVYDITNYQSFQKIEYWIDEIMKYKEYPDIDTPILLFGNKTDKAENRKITTEMGQNLANQYNLLFMEGSAEDSDKVDNIFDTLGTKIYSTFVEKALANKGIKYRFTTRKHSLCKLGDLCKGCTRCEKDNIMNKENNIKYRSNIECGKCFIL
jgi:small GTP-binding protein